MEMEDVPLEKKRHRDDAGAIEPVVEVKTKEEAQPDHYSKLQTPAEDVYAEAFFGDSPAKAKAGKQTEGNARRYRAGCLFLTMICLVLLLVVIVLSVKLQAGSQDCPKSGEAGTNRRDTGLTVHCNYDQCHTVFPKIQQLLGCNQCGDGWLMFEKTCFYMSTVRLSWAMSDRNCTAGGGSLAVISHQSVQTFLTGMDSKAFWIGLKRKGNQWRWVDNTALGDSYWEDNRAPGDCGLLKSRGPAQKNWMTERCDRSTYFICEKPA